MNALTLDRAALRNVIDASGDRRAGSPAGGSGGGVVTEAMIAEAVKPDCHCQDEAWMSKLNLPVLRPGLPIEDLHWLESGCRQGRWICSSLDQLRRRVGK